MSPIIGPCAILLYRFLESCKFDAKAPHCYIVPSIFISNFEQRKILAELSVTSLRGRGRQYPDSPDPVFNFRSLPQSPESQQLAVTELPRTMTLGQNSKH